MSKSQPFRLKTRFRMRLNPILILLIAIPIAAFLSGFTIRSYVAPFYTTIYVPHSITITKSVTKTITTTMLQVKTVVVTATFFATPPPPIFELNTSITLLSLLPVIQVRYLSNLDLKLTLLDPENRTIDTKLAPATRGTVYLMLAPACRTPLNGTYTLRIYDIVDRHLEDLKIALHVAKPSIKYPALYVKRNHSVVLTMRLPIANRGSSPLFITRIVIEACKAKKDLRNVCIAIPPHGTVTIYPIAIDLGNVPSGRYNITIRVYTDWGAETIASIPLVIP